MPPVFNRIDSILVRERAGKSTKGMLRISLPAVVKACSTSTTCVNHAASNKVTHAANALQALTVVLATGAENVAGMKTHDI